MLFFGIRARSIGCQDVKAFLGRCNERGIFPDAALEHLEELDNLRSSDPRRPLSARHAARLDRAFRAVLHRPPDVAWVVAGLGLMLGAPASAALMVAGGIGGVWDFVFLHLAFAGGALIVYCETVGRWR